MHSIQQSLSADHKNPRPLKSTFNSRLIIEGITHVGCWAHARRYFVDVIKAKKKNRSKRVQPKSLADEALEFIVRLYLIEKEAKARNLDAQGIYQLRQEKSKAVIEK